MLQSLEGTAVKTKKMAQFHFWAEAMGFFLTVTAVFKKYLHLTI